jgi:hypothetical protein
VEPGAIRPPMVAASSPHLSGKEKKMLFLIDHVQIIILKKLEVERNQYGTE